MSWSSATEDAEDQVLANIEKVDDGGECTRAGVSKKSPGDEVAEGPVKEKTNHASSLAHPRVARIGSSGLHGVSLAEDNFFSRAEDEKDEDVTRL
jgi:hypothetical protein